jgi:hypothetical protein
MTFYYSVRDSTYTVWIEYQGTKTYEASGNSLEMALGNLVYALSQGDDPNRKPLIKVIKKQSYYHEGDKV